MLAKDLIDDWKEIRSEWDVKSKCPVCGSKNRSWAQPHYMQCQDCNWWDFRGEGKKGMFPLYTGGQPYHDTESGEMHMGMRKECELCKEGVE